MAESAPQFGTHPDDDPVGLAEGAGFALRLHLQAGFPVEEDEEQPGGEHGARVAQGHPPPLGLVARHLLADRKPTFTGTLIPKITQH